MLRVFPKFPSECEKRTASTGTSQKIPGGFCGKCLNHLIRKQNVRVFGMIDRHLYVRLFPTIQSVFSLTSVFSIPVGQLNNAFFGN